MQVPAVGSCHFMGGIVRDQALPGVRFVSTALVVNRAPMHGALHFLLQWSMTMVPMLHPPFPTVNGVISVISSRNAPAPALDGWVSLATARRKNHTTLRENLIIFISDFSLLAFAVTSHAVTRKLNLALHLLSFLLLPKLSLNHLKFINV